MYQALLLGPLQEIIYSHKYSNCICILLVTKLRYRDVEYLTEIP